VLAAGWSLAVEPPQTWPALRTNRIAQVDADSEFDYYADAQWGDAAPQMCQAVLIRSFERAGAREGVASKRDRLRLDFMLNPRLGPFYALGPVGSAPEARVGGEAQLVRSRGRERVATSSLETSRAAASAEIDAVVAAFDEAAQAVMRDLVVWTVTAGNDAGGTA
jgi:ABC-type uncharacterized transport system auxiliary subunit